MIEIQREAGALVLVVWCGTAARCHQKWFTKLLEDEAMLVDADGEHCLRNHYCLELLISLIDANVEISAHQDIWVPAQRSWQQVSVLTAPWQPKWAAPSTNWPTIREDWEIWQGWHCDCAAWRGRDCAQGVQRPPASLCLFISTQKMRDFNHQDAVFMQPEGVDSATFHPAPDNV